MEINVGNWQYLFSLSAQYYVAVNNRVPSSRNPQQIR